MNLKAIIYNLKSDRCHITYKSLFIIRIISIIIAVFGLVYPVSLMAQNSFTVQHGETALSAGTGTVTVNLAQPVPVGESWILSTVRSSGDKFNRAQTTVNFVDGSIQANKFTQIVLNRDASDLSATVAWQVITGSKFTVQRGSTDVNNLTQVDVTISQVDLNRSFIVTSQITNLQTEGNQAFVSAEFVNNTTVRLRKENGTKKVTVAWFVIVWEGASVQRGAFDLSSSTSTTVSLASAVDLKNSFLLSTLRFTGIGDQSSRIFTRGEFSATNALTFTRNASTDNVLGAWFVVTHPNVGVQSGNVNGTSGGTTRTANLTHKIPLSKGFTTSPFMGNVQVSSNSITDGFHTFRLIEKEGEPGTVDRFQAERVGSSGTVTGSWFAVNSGPSFTSVAPNKGGQGATGLDLTVTGSDFQDAPQVSFSGSGITVNSVTFVSSSKLTVNIGIASGATTGTRDITIKNPDGGSVTAAAVFTVNTGPSFTSVDPNKGRQGATGLDLTVTGSNFQGAPQVSFSGSGITVNSVTLVSSSKLTVNIGIASGATTGTRNITIKNPDAGSVTTAGAFTVLIRPDDLTLGGPSSVTAGQKSSPFTLTVRDQNGDPVVVNKDTNFTLSSSSGGTVTFNPESPVTIAKGESAVDFTYTDTKSGTQTVTATWSAGDSELDGKNATHKITVVAKDAGELTIINQPGKTSAGKPIIGPPEVKVTDKFGNVIVGKDVKVNVVEGQSFDSGTLTVATSSNGVVTFDDLVINRAGTYSLRFSTNGFSNVDSQKFEVVSASADPGKSTADVPNATAGDVTDITITVRDAFGNPVPGEIGNLSIRVSGGPNAGTNFTSITANGDGTYSTSYTPVSSGSDMITITLSGTGISGSPFTSNVSSGDSSIDRTMADVPDGKVGEETLITITVRDKFGNPVTGVADALSLSITGANENVGFSGITDNGDGTYSVTYIPTRPGNDQIRITLNGNEIFGNPFTTEVNHGDVETLEIVSGDGQEQPTRSRLEEPLVVRALDLFGTPVPGETVIFAFTQTPSGAVDHEVAPGGVTTSDEGLAQTAVRLGSEGGTYRVQASTNGVSVEFTFTAEKTFPDPSFSDTVSSVVFTPDPNSIMFTEFDESLDQPQGFNFEFWLKPASLNSDGTVAGRWDENLGKQFRISLFDNTLVVELMDDDGNHYEMRIRNFARIIGIGSGNQDGLDLNVTRFQNEHLEFEWTHLSLVADPANEGVQVYVNGFEARRAQLISEIQPSTARLEVGRKFSGEIHEIRLWDRPRSSSEVRALKDLILSGSEDNLVLYHLFDEEDNERVALDASPNGNHSSLSDEVKRNRSLMKNTTRVKLNQNEDMIVRLSALDKTGGRTALSVESGSDPWGGDLSGRNVFNG